MLSSVPTASLSPRPKSQFPWSGTLIRLATGFCVSFASSSAVCAAAGKASASSIDDTLREILVAHAFIQVLFQRMSRRHQHSHPHVPINRRAHGLGPDHARMLRSEDPALRRNTCL